MGSGPSSATSLLGCYVSPFLSLGLSFPICKMAGGWVGPPLAWKGPPISGTLSISGPRSPLASASQALEVKRCCPETHFQVGMSPCDQC